MFAWEFWNEYDAPAEWVREMAAFLKQHDPNRHLVSTTYGNDEVWKIRRGGFHHDPSLRRPRQHRRFRRPDPSITRGASGPTASRSSSPNSASTGAPATRRMILKAKAKTCTTACGPAMMAGGAGTPMLWYWDGYVHPKNVYGSVSARGPVRRGHRLAAHAVRADRRPRRSPATIAAPNGSAIWSFRPSLVGEGKAACT